MIDDHEALRGGLEVLLGQAGLEVLGTARRVTVTKDTTTLVDGGGTAEAIGDRVAQIKREIDDTDSDWDREKLQERLAKLAGGVAVIKAGAATEVELKERKHRIEDAVRNAKAAVEEGVVPGGGVALLQAAIPGFDKLDLAGDEATGANIVPRNSTAPSGYWWCAPKAWPTRSAGSRLIWSMELSPESSNPSSPSISSFTTAERTSSRVNRSSNSRMKGPSAQDALLSLASPSRRALRPSNSRRFTSLPSMAPRARPSAPTASTASGSGLFQALDGCTPMSAPAPTAASPM